MAPRAALLGLACFSAAQGARVRRQASRSVAGVEITNFRENTEDFIILFKQGVDNAAIQNICGDNCELRGSPDAGGVPFAAVHGVDKMEQVVRASPQSIQLLEPDETEYMIPEMEMEEMEDSSAAASWGLDSVGVADQTATGKGVHIYVQDTGVRGSHQDFGGRVVPTLDMTQGSLMECKGSEANRCSVDRQGHGTHCAGTAAGTSFGVAKEATIHAVKTLSDSGSGQRSWQISAIDWIVTNAETPAVLSMSLGGRGQDQSYTAVIDAASEAGITVVVAAGNSNSDACFFSPAFAEKAITVGATTKDNTRASYSNYGKCNNIMAPGSAVVSASARSDTGSVALSGTSMACPHVSGAAALILEKNKNLKRDQILQRLVKSAAVDYIKGVKSDDPKEFLWVGDSKHPFGK